MDSVLSLLEAGFNPHNAVGGYDGTEISKDGRIFRTTWPKWHNNGDTISLRGCYLGDGYIHWDGTFYTAPADRTYCYWYKDRHKAITAEEIEAYLGRIK